MPNKALHPKNLPSLRYGNFSGELGRWAHYDDGQSIEGKGK